MRTIKPIRVLHVVGAMNVGGTETMLMNLLRRIDRARFRFDFVSYGKREAYYDEEIRSLGGRVIRLRRPGSVRELVEALRRHGPYDAVHAHTLFHCGVALTAAAIAGVPVRIAHAHTTDDRRGGVLRAAYFASMRAAIRRYATQRLACSDAAGRFLFGRDSSAYAVFPNAIDPLKFSGEDEGEAERLREAWGLATGIVVGHIGRFIEAKNHKFLIATLRRLVERDVDAKLLLVGDGDLRGEVEALARKEGVVERVRFAGLRDDIASMLRCMDVFAFPSTYEGLGLALLEAQAAGLPCVVSEAIQPEADLGLGLLRRVPLASGPGAWADAVAARAGKRERDRDAIVRAFEARGCSIDAGVARLATLYEGGIDEKRIYRFF